MKINNKIQKMLIIIILSICMLSIFTISNAATSFTTKLTVSSKTVKPGDEITVGITIADINVGNGIQAVQGTLTYDTEKLTYSSITASNGWGSPVYNPENGMIVIESSNYITTEQEIMKVTFKVKEEIETGTAQIQFSEVQASDGNIMAEGSTSATTLSISQTTPGDDSNQNQAGNNNTNQGGNNTNQAGNDTNQAGNENNTNQAGNENNTNQAGNENNTNQAGSGNNTNQAGSTNNANQAGNNQNTNSNASINNSSNNANINKQTSTNKQLPKTGINNTIIIIAIIAIIIATISFMKYKKYKGI